MLAIDGFADGGEARKQVLAFAQCRDLRHRLPFHADDVVFLLIHPDHAVEKIARPSRIWRGRPAAPSNPRRPWFRRREALGVVVPKAAPRSAPAAGCRGCRESPPRSSSATSTRWGLPISSSVRSWVGEKMMSRTSRYVPARRAVGVQFLHGDRLPIHVLVALRFGFAFAVRHQPRQVHRRLPGRRGLGMTGAQPAESQEKSEC